jgi:hypothetical protein
VIRLQYFATLLIVGVVVACSPDATTSVPPSLAAGIEATPSAAVSLAAASSTAPTAMPVPTPTPTLTIAPTPVPTPVPWKAYKSKRYHYSISYVSSWIVTPGTTKLSDRFDPYLYPRSGPIQPNVWISRDVSTNISVSRTAAGLIAAAKKDYKAKLTSNKAIRLHGYAGRILVFEGTNGSYKIRVERIFIARGKVGYFISLYTDLTTATADHATFKKMYQSWKPT